jgi:hypothetical protein
MNCTHNFKVCFKGGRKRDPACSRWDRKKHFKVPLKYFLHNHFALIILDFRVS